MSEFSNLAEYSVKKSRSAFFRVTKIAVPIISIVLSIFISNMIVGIYGLLIGVISLVVLLASSLIFSAKYFRRVDYDYRIVGGELFFSVVYNRRKRKELGSVDIAKLDRIAPYAGEYLDELEKVSCDKIYDFSSSPNDPYVFYAVQNDEENKTKALFLFNASEKMLQIIKLYNRRAVITYPNE